MWIKALRFLNSVRLKAKDNLIVDKTEEDVFVLAGSHWVLVNKNSINLGKAGERGLLVSVQLKQGHAGSGVAALLGRMTGKINRTWLLVSPPGSVALRVGVERSGMNSSEGSRVFGFIKRHEDEGLYWGKWAIESGDPDQSKLLFDIKRPE